MKSGLIILLGLLMTFFLLACPPDDDDDNDDFTPDDDDTIDDDTTDDDSVDDDTTDDDTVDDDTTDDDTTDDDTVILNPTPEIAVNGPVCFSTGSIARQPDGNLAAVAYGERRLYLYIISPGVKASAATEVIAEGLYLHTSLTVDDAGNHHVVAKNDDDDLIYFTDATGEWTTENLTPGDLSGYVPRLRHDADGALHLIYSRLIDDLWRIVYATNATGEWMHSVINQEDPFYLDYNLAVDDQGVVYVAYTTRPAARHWPFYLASNASGAWVTENIFTDTTSYTVDRLSLSVDGAGNVHLCYYALKSDDETGIWYATDATGEWTGEVVSQLNSIDESLVRPTMVIDSSGAAYIYYLRKYNGTLINSTYAARRQEGGEWTQTAIASDNVVVLDSVIDEADRPHLYYYQYSGELAYREGGLDPTGNDWLTLHAGVNFSSWTPLTVNPATYRPHIVMQNNWDDNVYHVDKEGDDWRIEKIGHAGSGDFDAAIFVDAQGVVHVAYNDRDENELIYAANPSGEWKSTVIDQTSGGLSFPTLAVDSSGFVYLAYADSESDYRLRYASNRSGQWQFEDIDADDVYFFRNLKIVVTASGTIMICYLKTAYLGPGTLFLAEKSTDAATWQFDAIEALVDPYTNNLALDSDNRPHVAYLLRNMVSGENSIRYAYRQAGQWFAETVGPTGVLQVAMVLDNQDFAHLTYTLDNEPMYYSTNATGDWTEAVLDSYEAESTYLAQGGNNMIQAANKDDNTLWYRDFLVGP